MDENLKLSQYLGFLRIGAAAVEAGIEIDNIAESGLIDYGQLHSFWQL